MMLVPDSLRADSQGGSAPATLGKYEILDLLAVGGMAEILLARSVGIEGFVKHVVIKRILPQFASEQRFVSMFADEARLAACLQHQNIAQVYDIGVDGGEYFFAMEYVHGQDVGTVLREVTKRGQRLPLAEALTIAAGIASGLAYAHERKGPDGQSLGIVHRDISPSNVLVSYEGGIKLVDFGIARATIRNTETRTGAVKGKLSYMSPEQCLGEELNHRSDIFSLGVVLYELTTSARMFRYKADDSDYLVMNRIVTGKVVPPTEHLPNYPPGLQAIVLKAVARDPADRYQSARALLVDLESFAGKAGIPLSQSALSRYLTKVFGRRPEPWRQGPDVRNTAAVGPMASAGDPAGMDDSGEFDSQDDDTVAEAIHDPHGVLENSRQVEPWGLPEELSPDESFADESFADEGPETVESPRPEEDPASGGQSDAIEPQPFGEPSGSLSEAWFAKTPAGEVSTLRTRPRSGRRMTLAAVLALLALVAAAFVFYATSLRDGERAVTAPAEHPAEPARSATPQPEPAPEALPAEPAKSSSRSDTQPEASSAAPPPESGAGQGDSASAAENPDSTASPSDKAPSEPDEPGEPESGETPSAAKDDSAAEENDSAAEAEDRKAQPSKAKRSSRSKRSRAKPAKKRRPKAKPQRKRVNDLIDTRW